MSSRNASPRPLLLCLALAALSTGMADNSAPVVSPDAPPVETSGIAVVLESNAAVVYRQAFEAIPKLTEAENALIATKSGQIIDPVAGNALLAKYEKSFQLIDQGASMFKCDWELDLQKGIELGVPHVMNALSLTKAFRLRATLRLQAGDAPGATTDLLRMLRLGRAVSEPPLLISCLVQNTIDILACERAARMLPMFDAASLRAFSDGLANLPTAPTARDAIPFERKCVAEWLRNRALTSIANRDSTGWTQIVQPIIGMQTDPKMARLLSAPPSIYISWLEGADRALGELEKLLPLPYPQYLTRLAVLQKKFNQEKLANPLATFLTEPLCSVRSRDAVMEARWAMLLAAIDAQIDHPDTIRAELAKAHDPFGVGPFKCRDVPGGVELQSKLIDTNQKPVKLIIGIAGK